MSTSKAILNRLDVKLAMADMLNCGLCWNMLGPIVINN